MLTRRVVPRLPDVSQPQPLITWGGYDQDEKLKLPSLMELRSSYGWCLNDAEMEQLKAYQDELAEATSTYLGDDDIRRLRLAVELAYQSRAWSKTEGRSDARLSHAVAVARCLADLQMEVEAVVAALLGGVCEDTGLSLKQVDEVLGPTVASAVRDLTNVWRLSDVMQVCFGGMRLLTPLFPHAPHTRAPKTLTPPAPFALVQNAPAEDSEQLEHRCQIVLAGCDDWRGVVLSLASRLVAARTLQAEAERRTEFGLLGSMPATAMPRDVPPPPAEDEAPPPPPFASAAAVREPTTAPPPATTAPAVATEGVVDGVEAEAETMAKQSEKITVASSNRFATQTLQIFVPLAHRLGMWYFKTELEQRCFAIASPREFAALSAQLEEVQKAHASTLYSTAQRLREALLADPVLAQHADWVRVQARAKAAYSAHVKMQRQGKSLDDLDDLLGLRVIFRPRVDRKLPMGLHRQRQCMLCYRVLEITHALYPMAGRKAGSSAQCIKDYVTQPKPNGYQSLHSTIRLTDEITSELQIRTSEMHRYAEHGKAAHWLFKCDDGRPADDWYDLGLDQAVMNATASAIAAANAANPRKQRDRRQRPFEREAPPAVARPAASKSPAEPSVAAAAMAAKALRETERGGGWSTVAGVASPTEGSKEKSADDLDAALVDAMEEAMVTRPSASAAADDVAGGGASSNGDSVKAAAADADATKRPTWSSGVQVEVGVWQRGDEAAAKSDDSTSRGQERSSAASETDSADTASRSSSSRAGRKPRGLTRSVIQRSQPVLEAVRTRLREKRVYATTMDGTVLSLRAGADLQEALAALRARSGTPGGGPTTARVNGRTVRRGYKIQNGDVLTPLQVTGLNSLAWVAPFGSERAERSSSAAAGGKAGSAAVGGTGSAVTDGVDWSSLPVPWPWSLVGSNAAEDSMSWLIEAEAKHGAVAAVALANWLALASLGEVSLAADPLAALSQTLPAATWALQGGAVALAEASALHSSTSALIRANERKRRADSAAATSSAAAVAGEAAVAGGDALAATPEVANVTSASVPVAASSELAAGEGKLEDSFESGFLRGFEIAAPQFVWSVGFVETLNSLRQAQVLSAERWRLWLGRCAMLSMACLALHADVTHGLIHSFLDVDDAATTLTATPPTPPADETPTSTDLNVAFTGSLASDVTLQDIPLDLRK